MTPLVWTEFLRKKLEVNICKGCPLPHLFKGFCALFEKKTSFKVNQENVSKTFNNVALVP